MSEKMPIRLRVFDTTKDEEIRCLELNYSSRHHRKRISKTIFWALNANHAVELVKVDVDDKQTDQ